jgi:hypothetical protein
VRYPPILAGHRTGPSRPLRPLHNAQHGHYKSACVQTASGQITQVVASQASYACKRKVPLAHRQGRELAGYSVNRGRSDLFDQIFSTAL